MPRPEAGPITRADAMRSGVTRARLAGPAYRRLFASVYLPAQVPVTTEVRARAALLVAPAGAVVARHTAAELLGAVAPPSADLHLTLPSGRMRVTGVDARRGTPTRLVTWRGLPLTCAEDTFVGLGADLSLVELVVLGDSLVAAGRCRPGDLVEAAADARGRHGPLVRRAASLVRSGVDSAMETRLRLLLVLAGLPEPTVNHVEYDETGRWRRRFDLAYPQVRLAVEYDGRHHAQTQRQWERDIERREELDADGWRLVVVLAAGIYREPGRTLGRVVAAMADQGLRAAVTSHEWELHFPGVHR